MRAQSRKNSSQLGKKLHFYTNYSEEKHQNDIEVDFQISDRLLQKYKVRPIEVKSSKNNTEVSYDRFEKRFGKRVRESLVVHPKHFQRNRNGYRIPSYMLFCELS